MKYPKPKTKFQAEMGLKLVSVKRNPSDDDKEFKRACEEILMEKEQ